ncbi:MAG: membrane protein insertase YidC, partial [Alphaproteobacteria bacterium]|nr:membrane protein insertase YidC [Alphaproteobacteria bacterium]
MSFGNEDQNSSKNFIIAMVLFMVIMFGYEYFSENKNQNTNVQNTEEVVSEQENTEDDSNNQKTEVLEKKLLTIDEALNDPNRVSLENAHMRGSINLYGGVIDSIILKDYKESTDENSKNVMLLTPKNTEHQFYYAISYNDITNKELISEESIWTSDTPESGKQSVVLKTQTQKGLIIERTITFDDNYLINIKDKIINISNQPIEL